MVVGDKLKFLSAILTLKYDLDKNGKYFIKSYIID